MDILEWKRTGKISLRSVDLEYLIIHYPDQHGKPRYTALHGPQTMRKTLRTGLDSAKAAKAVCEAHRQKEADPE